MTAWKTLRQRILADPEVRAEYEALRLEDRLAAELTRARVAVGLTQRQLAAQLRVTQAAVARIESGRHLPSLATLRSYAAATGRRLVIGFEPVAEGNGRRGARARKVSHPAAAE